MSHHISLHHDKSYKVAATTSLRGTHSVTESVLAATPPDGVADRQLQFERHLQLPVQLQSDCTAHKKACRECMYASVRR